MKPLILISQRLWSNAEYPEQRETLDIRWGAFLNTCGLLPVPVLTETTLSDYFDLAPAGVLLTGGNDLASLAPQDPLNALRDKTEGSLIRLAIERKLPVVGVCRGMQMLAHHFGAGLEDRGSEHVRKNHAVRVESGTEIGKAYPKDPNVNSFHRYCVTTVKAPMRVAASASDGTVEAVEVPAQRVFGLMWHPERNEPFRPADIQFFKNVFGKGK